MRFVVVAGCLFLSLVSEATSKVQGTMSFQGDTVHLELTGQQNWDYDLKKLEDKGKTIVQLTVPALDEATITSFNSFKSEFVTGVSVDAKGPDGKSVVSFALSGDEIDTFDYLTDQPSRLIVDFYVNPTSKAAKTKKIDKVEPKKEASVRKPLKKQENVKTDPARKPATTDVLVVANQGTPTSTTDGSANIGIFDGGDPQYERFAIKDYEVKEDAIIKAKGNYYIPFPMMETPVNQWERLKVTPTIYEISAKPTDENKQARLLLTLFEKKRYGVYLKTHEWFVNKYPKSEYNEVLDYMTADAQLEQWKSSGHLSDYEKAIQLYREAVQKHPKSVLAERTSLKIGFLALEKGDTLNALRFFQDHIRQKTYGEMSKDLARLGSGLAYTKLNKWQDAVSEYDYLEKNSTNRDFKVEGAYRRGDVWTKANDYGKAVASYQEALKNYPEGRTAYPNALFNQAESLFGLKDYRKSLDTYRDFVREFPSNSHSPYAMTRLGEILEILGADKSRVVGAYLETYFRYGESPEAIVARLRLLSARMKGMKPKEVKHAVDEIMSLAKKIDLPNMEQFATVMVADAYTSRGEQQNAIDLLSRYYKEHPSTVDVPLITRRIVSNINDKIGNEIADGNFIAALKTHTQYADNWLKNSKRLDTKFNLGKAFEMAGVPVEAEKYYRDVLNKVYAIRGTNEAKEISVTERLPSEDELNLRLAAIASQEGKHSQAYDFLKNIKKPEMMSENAQIERVTLAVRLLEKRGDTDSAVRYLGELLRTWKGQPALVADPYLQLAELEQKQGKTTEALEALGMVDRLASDSEGVPAAIHAKALEDMGKILIEKKKTADAMNIYQKLLDKYEETRPLASIRYKLGQLHFKKGDVQDAAKIWNEFKGPKSEFWKNLAQEQLKDSEWRSDYKKYIKRIPAMSENENGQ